MSNNNEFYQEFFNSFRMLGDMSQCLIVPKCCTTPFEKCIKCCLLSNKLPSLKQLSLVSLLTNSNYDFRTVMEYLSKINIQSNIDFFVKINDYNEYDKNLKGEYNLLIKYLFTINAAGEQFSNSFTSKCAIDFEIFCRTQMFTLLKRFSIRRKIKEVFLIYSLVKSTFEYKKNLINVMIDLGYANLIFFTLTKWHCNLLDDHLSTFLIRAYSTNFKEIFRVNDAFLEKVFLLHTSTFQKLLNSFLNQNKCLSRNKLHDLFNTMFNNTSRLNTLSCVLHYFGKKARFIPIQLIEGIHPDPSEDGIKILELYHNYFVKLCRTKTLIQLVEYYYNLCPMINMNDMRWNFQRIYFYLNMDQIYKLETMFPCLTLIDSQDRFAHEHVRAGSTTLIFRLFRYMNSNTHFDWQNELPNTETKEYLNMLLFTKLRDSRLCRMILDRFSSNICNKIFSIISSSLKYNYFTMFEYILMTVIGVDEINEFNHFIQYSLSKLNEMSVDYQLTFDVIERIFLFISKDPESFAHCLAFLNLSTYSQLDFGAIIDVFEQCFDYLIVFKEGYTSNNWMLTTNDKMLESIVDARWLTILLKYLQFNLIDFKYHSPSFFSNYVTFLPFKTAIVDFISTIIKFNLVSFAKIAQFIECFLSNNYFDTQQYLVDVYSLVKHDESRRKIFFKHFNDYFEVSILSHLEKTDWHLITKVFRPLNMLKCIDLEDAVCYLHFYNFCYLFSIIKSSPKQLIKAGMPNYYQILFFKTQLSFKGIDHDTFNPLVYRLYVCVRECTCNLMKKQMLINLRASTFFDLFRSNSRFVKSLGNIGLEIGDLKIFETTLIGKLDIDDVKERILFNVLRYLDIKTIYELYAQLVRIEKSETLNFFFERTCNLKSLISYAIKNNHIEILKNLGLYFDAQIKYTLLSRGVFLDTFSINIEQQNMCKKKAKLLKFLLHDQALI